MHIFPAQLYLQVCLLQFYSVQPKIIQPVEDLAGRLMHQAGPVEVVTPGARAHVVGGEECKGAGREVVAEATENINQLVSTTSLGQGSLYNSLGVPKFFESTSNRLKLVNWRDLGSKSGHDCHKLLHYVWEVRPVVSGSQQLCPTATAAMYSSS